MREGDRAIPPILSRGQSQVNRSQVCTGGCTKCAHQAPMTHLTRVAKPSRLGYAGQNGRTWDRTRDLSRVKRALSR
jgi:hypothetical protein